MIVPADYTTLDYVKRTFMQANLDVDTSDDPLIIDFIRGASGFMSARTNRSFVPQMDRKTFDFERSAWTWVKPFDLLELTELLNGDNTVIDPAHFSLAPRNLWPKFKIELLSSSGIMFFYDNGDWQEAIKATGFWGFHDSYPNAWVTTRENVPAGGLAVDDETMIVTAIDGLDSESRQRFEKRQYLRIEDEILQVIDRVISDDIVPVHTLTLNRGALGTTAIDHDEALPIKRYRQVEAIELMCERLVGWLYQHRDTSGGAIQLLNGSTILKDTTLEDVFDQLGTYESPLMLVARG